MQLTETQVRILRALPAPHDQAASARDIATQAGLGYSTVTKQLRWFGQADLAAKAGDGWIATSSTSTAITEPATDTATAAAEAPADNTTEPPTTASNPAAADNATTVPDDPSAVTGVDAAGTQAVPETADDPMVPVAELGIDLGGDDDDGPASGPGDRHATDSAATAGMPIDFDTAAETGPLTSADDASAPAAHHDGDNGDLGGDVPGAKNATARLRHGELEVLVAGHLSQRRGETLTPYAIGRAVGHSPGAVVLACERLARKGQIEDVSDTKRKFVHR